MNEFKDYATMLEEKKIKAKKKRDEVKRLRDEANFKERQERYKTWEEDRDIIANVRLYFTAEQIANGEYFTLNGIQENQNTYESKEERVKMFFNNHANKIKFIEIEDRLKWLEEKIVWIFDEEKMNKD